MKNLMKIMPVVAVLAFTGCKKTENADQLTAQEAPKVEVPAAVSQDDLIKEAQNKPMTNLALSEDRFDFGKIKKGETVQHVYTVTNTGENPLIISSVKPACGCTAPDYTKEPILPGKTGQITLMFDSTNFDGIVNKQAEVYANVEKAPIVIYFTADIQTK